MNTSSLEEGIDITPDISEFMSTSTMMAGVQIFGLMLTVIVGWILQSESGEKQHESAGKVQGAMVFLCFVGCIACVLSVFSSRQKPGKTRTSNMRNALNHVDEHLLDSI